MHSFLKAMILGVMLGIFGCLEGEVDNSAVSSSLTASDGGTTLADATMSAPDCPKCMSGTCMVDSDCEDTDFCTIDRCVGGKCKHKPAEGSAKQCGIEKCENGGYVYYPYPDGTPCNDGNPCTLGDKCAGGGLCKGELVDQCGGGGSCSGDMECDDKNYCTADSCQSGACVHERMKQGSPCDDGKLCTLDDACNWAGVCLGVWGSCVTEDKCKGSSCNPSTGGCTFYNKNCHDNDPCTIDSCDPEFGCAHTPKNCNDGNACTVDSCNSETGCCESVPDKCDDGDACTFDFCKPAVGCVHTPKNCNDGDVCTVDSCDPMTGVCSNVPKNCDDGNSCTKDFCDAGRCINLPVIGAVCDDGNMCTVVDRCDRTGKCVGESRNCDDKNPCTKDFCVRATGCVHTSLVGPCDDGNECTVGDACLGGSCIAGQIKNCSDGNSCTNDWCDKLAGACFHSMNPLCK